MKAKATMALSMALSVSAGIVIFQMAVSGMAMSPLVVALLFHLVLADALLIGISRTALRAEQQAELPVAERLSRECGLSVREREVLEKYLAVRDIRTCASELYISSGTVKTHLSHIYGKTGVAGCQELLAYCDAYGKAA